MFKFIHGILCGYKMYNVYYKVYFAVNCANFAQKSPINVQAIKRQHLYVILINVCLFVISVTIILMNDT